MILAVALAVVSAALFGIGTALQSHAAGDQRSSLSSSGHGLVAALRRTMTRPLWLTGVLVDWAGTGSHIAALRFGPLSVVQPLALSAVVFAVPVEALCRRQRLSMGHVLAAAQTAIGLGLLVALLHGHEYRPALVPAWATWASSAAVILTPVLAAALVRGDRARAFLLGAAAGSLFGTAAALVRNLQLAWTATPDAAWAAGAVAAVLVSAAGLLMSQAALHRGHLSWSLPMQDCMALVVSIGIGAARFGDISHQNWTSASLAGLALALATAGIWRLSRTHEPRDLVTPG